MRNLVDRLQKQNIVGAMSTRRVILLNGPRQCGKTTLAKQLNLENVTYRTLDDLALLKAAQIDPSGFIKQSQGCMIIDEIQRAPSLITAIKKAVDEDMRPGQFLLTGSADIYALPQVQESLAGRIQKIRLRTLTQSEMNISHKPSFLDRAFQENFCIQNSQEDKESILQHCFRGGFPEAVELSDQQRKRWHKDYINALLEKDVRDVAQIQRHHALKELMSVTCAWSGKLLDVSKIEATLSIQRQTLENYLRILEAMYLMERLKPWTKTDYQRVGRQSKMFVTDTGLICSLLGWNMKEVLFNSDRSGKIMETLVYNELAAHVDAHDGLYEFYHYRDRTGHEVDFILEREDGQLLGIEVKAGSSVGLEDFKHLMWMRNTLAPDRFSVGIVLYTGEHILRFGESMWAVPFSDMWIA